MLRLGLTGGIGSGKSTVSHMLMDCGAHLIDADAISRACTATGGIAIDAIAAAFGPHMIRTDGALDRDQMRGLAYADPSARKRLEGILHPLIGKEIARQTQLALDLKTRCLVFDIPLLAESDHWRSKLDCVLVIDCPEETQIRRVLARSGLSEAETRAILATQASRPKRLACADYVISNAGNELAALQAEVAALCLFLGLTTQKAGRRDQTESTGLSSV